MSTGVAGDRLVSVVLANPVINRVRRLRIPGFGDVDKVPIVSGRIVPRGRRQVVLSSLVRHLTVMSDTNCIKLRFHGAKCMWQ